MSSNRGSPQPYTTHPSLSRAGFALSENRYPIHRTRLDDGLLLRVAGIELSLPAEKRVAPYYFKGRSMPIKDQAALANSREPALVFYRPEEGETTLIYTRNISPHPPTHLGSLLL